MVFNVVARNQDDHTKNISFLMDRSGQWRLSPAYDISWSYNPQGVWTASHQMSINNKWEDITRADLMHVAEEMHIQEGTAIVDEVCEAVSQWSALARQYEIPNDMIAIVEQSLLYQTMTR
jgi:serine/threonine-protein kinase HipA